MCMHFSISIAIIKAIHKDLASSLVYVQLFLILRQKHCHTRTMKFGYRYAAWFLPASVNAIPRFLLAGQSNMEDMVG